MNMKDGHLRLRQRSQPINRVKIYDIFLIYAIFLTMAKIAVVYFVVALSIRLALSRGKGEKLSVKMF